MKLSCCAETDSLYIELRTGPGAETREMMDGLNVHLDDAGQVIGFDIDHASAKLDLSVLKTVDLPIRPSQTI